MKLNTWYRFQELFVENIIMRLYIGKETSSVENSDDKENLRPIMCDIKQSFVSHISQNNQDGM